MYKLAIKFLAYCVSIFYIGLIFIMPFNWHHIGSNSEIFPAFDLIIIYYISTYKSIKNWHLFLLGLLIDQLYQIPIGTSSISLIIANLSLNQSRSKFFLKGYYTNIGIFCVYSMLVISLRFLIVTIKSAHYIQGISVYFYYFTTIFSYPIIKMLIKKPMRLIKIYA